MALNGALSLNAAPGNSQKTHNTEERERKAIQFIQAALELTHELFIGMLEDVFTEEETVSFNIPQKNRFTTTPQLLKRHNACCAIYKEPHTETTEPMMFFPCCSSVPQKGIDGIGPVKLQHPDSFVHSSCLITWLKEERKIQRKESKPRVA